MTDLTKLKVSLTKHGAHKLFNLLNQMPPGSVLQNTWNQIDGIKIDQAQARKTLAIDAKGEALKIWEKAKEAGAPTLRQLVFLAIVFSHHQLIDVFSNSLTGNYGGRIARGSGIDGKAFTNLKNDVLELGFSTNHNSEFVEYDLKPIFQNPKIGPLFSSLITLKLLSVGWSQQNSLIEECITLGVDRVLSTNPDEFSQLLIGNIANTLDKASGNQHSHSSNSERNSSFTFRSGHVPRQEGKMERGKQTTNSQVELTHNAYQTLAYDILSSVYGPENVGTEVNAGIGGNSIDIVVNHNNQCTFYEIKTDKSIRNCIREALPQLLEYAFWPAENRAEKLVIVSGCKITSDAKSYLSKLRRDFSIPIYFSQIDMDRKSLSDPI